MTNFFPRIKEDQINQYVEKYFYKGSSQSYAHIESLVRDRIGVNYYLTKSDLAELLRWKSPRTLRLSDMNTEEEVRQYSNEAFRASSDLDRMLHLKKIKGVSWSVGSVILHFTFENEYPIIDYRALWSLGAPYVVQNQQHSFYFSGKRWLDYVEITRKLARKHHLTMRQLDKALWAYSKEQSGKPA